MGVDKLERKLKRQNRVRICERKSEDKCSIPKPSEEAKQHSKAE